MTVAATPGVNAWLLRSLELRALVGVAVACTGIFAGLCLLAPLALVCLPLWPAAEVAFYFVWRRKRDVLDAIPERHEPDKHDAWRHFQRWHDSSHHHVKVLALAELIKCWFEGVPTMEIKRGNAAELVARGYFYKTMDKLRAEGKEQLVEDMLTEIEAVWGYRFADGINPSLQYLDHLQEPLKVTYRPLIFYAFCEAAAAVKHITLLAAGFTGHSHGPYTYYTRGLPSEREATCGRRASGLRDPAGLHPIVFLHGVGAGLLPYIPFLLRTTALGRPMLAIEFRHLSMRWTDHIPTAPQVAADMSRILDLHGIRRVSMVAHSYGSFYVSCMLKLAPERVHAVCLLDPVCCCMWSGHLITSFVYNPARSTTGLITWLIARDIHTATTVSRNFFWTDVNLWPDEVPQHAVVALSGKDDLVPVRQVYTMLREETSARILYHPGMVHADFLFSPSWQNRVLCEMAELVQMPSGSPSSSGRRSPALSSVGSGCATASVTLSGAAASLAKQSD